MSLNTFSRPGVRPGVKKLLNDSTIAFVGEVKTINPSQIQTELYYWTGVTFDWLEVEMEVTFPLKSCQKSQKVKVMILADKLFDWGEPISFVNLKVGKQYLCGLCPSSRKDFYASVTGPIDEEAAIILLDRKSLRPPRVVDPGEEKVRLRNREPTAEILWQLVDDEGGLNLEALEELKIAFAEQIENPPNKDQVIELVWKRKEGEKKQ